VIKTFSQVQDCESRRVGGTIEDLEGQEIRSTGIPASGAPAEAARAESGESNMANDLESRIDAMYSRDRIFAWGFVIALWATVLFVLLAVQSYIADSSILVVCWIAAAVLLLFNTTSIWAMVRHYGHDKSHIYGTDIKHLDAGR
jgi:hypothetical protein